ncbi:thiol-disulfide isomerase/thioredoxin [Rhodopirellula rubra]|uniref:Thiol-disulfide isomerase/thioredoxin n=2 Tax=Aporhodopirellula rubra TaxID=980271 RepID=A0A7W5DYV3_9BACT|nr:trypsin-like peptidase domain-containing protein [Aporhodopirellula rubra]MBB3207026.1 thiol-disulfide isomerase/thioredoxin [Aporhodopirellula rubra]
MRLTPTIQRATIAPAWCVTLLMMAVVGFAGTVSADAVLLEFSSSNCPPCRAMQPIVSELIARGVPVRQVDVHSEPQLVQRYQVRSTPTYVILREGREVTRLVGAQSAAQLRAALQQSPSGKIVPTGSQIAAPTRRSPSLSEQQRIQEPQTRLAPLSAHAGGMSSSANRSVRREREDNDWRSLESLTSATAPNANVANNSFGRSQEVVVEAMPSISLADAVERAHAATVRLRVYDGRGYGAGTGTIIDVHGEEALVLTCGHLFRDGDGKDKIEVDLFVGGEPHTVTGQLVDFDAGDRDIGLVAIRPGMPVQPVKVVTASDKMKVGQTAFSFGCDRGDPPSRRDTRITGVNKYNQNIGGSNLEISGAPIDGRSGGGLFDERGVLIGVCNAADYKSDIGIYTGPGSIHWQLDRVQLSRLYQGDSNQSLASNEVVTGNQFDAMPPAVEEPAMNQFASTPAFGAAALDTGDTEMIVILRDRDGNVREQVLTLRQPDAHLVQQIRQAARR